MFDIEHSGHSGFDGSGKGLGETGTGTFATAESRVFRNLDDTIPLHAIKVTDRVDVSRDGER